MFTVDSGDGVSTREACRSLRPAQCPRKCWERVLRIGAKLAKGRGGFLNHAFFGIAESFSKSLHDRSVRPGNVPSAGGPTADVRFWVLQGSQQGWNGCAGGRSHERQRIGSPKPDIFIWIAEQRRDVLDPSEAIGLMRLIA